MRISGVNCQTAKFAINPLSLKQRGKYRMANIPADDERRFYKFINAEWRHWGLAYRVGLMVDPVPFRPYGEGEAGGLYFTTAEGLRDFTNMGVNIADIRLLPESRVHISPKGLMKADRFMVEAIVPAQEHVLTKNKEWILFMVGSCYFDRIFDINKFDNEMKAQMVGLDGRLLKLVDWQLVDAELQKENDPTNRKIFFKICEAAVSNFPEALEFIENRPEIKLTQQELTAIRLKVVAKAGWCIMFIDEPTEEMKIAAIDNDGGCLWHIKKPSEELCLRAIGKSERAIINLRRRDDVKITDRMRLAAYEKNPREVEFLPNSTYEKYLEAVGRDGWCLTFVPKELVDKKLFDIARQNVDNKEHFDVSFKKFRQKFGK